MEKEDLQMLQTNVHTLSPFWEVSISDISLLHHKHYKIVCSIEWRRPVESADEKQLKCGVASKLDQRTPRSSKGILYINHKNDEAQYIQPMTPQAVKINVGGENSIL